MYPLLGWEQLLLKGRFRIFDYLVWHSISPIMIPTRNFDLLERLTTSFPGKHILSEKINDRWQFYTAEEYS